MVSQTAVRLAGGGREGGREGRTQINASFNSIIKSCAVFVATHLFCESSEGLW